MYTFQHPRNRSCRWKCGGHFCDYRCERQADESAEWYSVRERIIRSNNDERHRPLRNKQTKKDFSVYICCIFQRQFRLRSAAEWTFENDYGKHFCNVLKKRNKKQTKTKQQELRAPSDTVPGNADKLVEQVGTDAWGVHFTSGISLLHDQQSWSSELGRLICAVCGGKCDFLCDVSTLLVECTVPQLLVLFCRCFKWNDWESVIGLSKHHRTSFFPPMCSHKTVKDCFGIHAKPKCGTATLRRTKREKCEC